MSQAYFLTGTDTEIGKTFITCALLHHAAQRGLRAAGIVVDYLEAWAAERAAETMVALFLVAAGVTVAAFPAGVALGARPRMLPDETAGLGGLAAGGGDGDGARPGEDAEPTLTL